MGLDPRIKRTHQRLHQAVIELIMEKRFDAISIRDITARANIGYATFFRHYSDKDALLLAVMGTAIDELTSLLQTSRGDNPVRDGTLIFEYVAAHESLFRGLLLGLGTHHLIEEAKDVSVARTMAAFGGNSQDRTTLKAVANHVVTSTIALITWWLQDDKPCSPHAMGKLYADLIVMPSRVPAGATGMPRSVAA